MRKLIAVVSVLTLFAGPSLSLAHGGHGHVKGTIAEASADRLEVRTTDGKTVSIPIKKETKLLKGSKRAQASDLKAGARVVVHLGADGSATEVHLSSGPAKTQSPHPRM